MAPDPTGARTRTLNAFFHAPRVPVKELPDARGGGQHRDREDGDDGRHDGDGVQLEGWNAYVGAPGRAP